MDGALQVVAALVCLVLAIIGLAANCRGVRTFGSAPKQANAQVDRHKGVLANAPTDSACYLLLQTALEDAYQCFLMDL